MTKGEDNIERESEGFLLLKRQFSFQVANHSYEKEEKQKVALGIYNKKGYFFTIKINPLKMIVKQVIIFRRERVFGFFLHISPA